MTMQISRTRIISDKYLISTAISWNFNVSQNGSGWISFSFLTAAGDRAQDLLSLSLSVVYCLGSQVVN